MKNKKVLNKKISTELGVGVILLVAIVIGGAFYLKGKKGNNTETPLNNSVSVNVTNKYMNTDYGFSLDLPYSLDKYVVNVSPSTIAKISFSLPATNRKFIEYTGHALVDAFNVLVYPKSEIDSIRKECQGGTSKYLDYECSSLSSEQPIAESNMYSFYYLKGGVYLGAYPQALDKEEYDKSEDALKTFKAFKWSLNFDPTAWHVFTDNKYGYEMEYPSDWRGGSSDTFGLHNQDLVPVFSMSGPIADGVNGSMLFGKYSFYNNGLTDSVDENVKILNSKVKFKLKEVKIIGGRAFYNPARSTPMSNERNIFIVGKNVIFNGSVTISPSSTMDSRKLNRFADLLSHFKFLQ